MAIYEKFIGRTRESFYNLSLNEAREQYKITYPDDFNFAYDVIDVLGTTKPNKEALYYISNDKKEKRFTFRDMMTYSSKAANYFTSLGIKKGDRVLLVLKRSYLFWFAMLGLHKIGAVAIQATHMLKASDYVYRCNKANIKAVILTGDGDCTCHFDEALDSCPTVKFRLVTKHKKVNGWLDFEQGLENASDSFDRPEGKDKIMATDTLIVAFSSGTTGYPKMIEHDHTYPLGHICTGVFWHRVIDGGLHFTISDTGWLKSLWGKFYGQWMGESSVLVYDFEKFDGADILSVIEKAKVTTLCVPPTMYRLLLLNDITKYDLTSLKHCCAAGEALNAEIFNTWKEATGLEIYEGFGQTETTICLGTLYPFTKPVPGFMGLPVLGYDIELIDSDGNICMPGEAGEICIKATMDNRPCGLFKGYYQDDAANEKAWKGGYYHTGDEANRDEHNFFHYIGRNDDVIKSSGYRIGPFEVDSVLLEHPAVLEVAVTGVPDAIRGFNVKATIVLRKGYIASDELAVELQNHVKNTTAPYKYPRIVEFVQELPKTFNGKIRRGEIRQKDMEKQTDN
ncbi:MAG: AMP-binding protein [Clostridiales bacterium]|nr:AMP-binding protein [Clostridiales bacterium]